MTDGIRQVQEVSEPLIALVAALVAAIAPITAQVLSRAKLKLAERAQQHKLELARVAQHHQIATAYLDRALNPEVPLAMRQQLLRFLSTKGDAGLQLQNWAGAELLRVDAVVEGLDREVEEAERSLHEAKNPKDLRIAESKLAAAVARKQSAIEPRRRAPVTAAAIRAGFFDLNRDDLDEVVLEGEDIRGARITYSGLRGARLSRAVLDEASLQGSDLRLADLSTTSCKRTSFYHADLRGANLSGADLTKADLREAQLHGANLKDCTLNGANLMVLYDGKTTWPEGFDPSAAGAVLDDG